jgi:peptide/nickel transport system substrate-binding protein
VAAACTPPAAVPETEAPGEEPAEPEAPEEEPAEPEAPEEQVWPRGEVAREKTLVYMYGPAEFGNVGIAGPYADGFNHQHGHAAELEAMFYYAALADKTYPWLAESYEYNDDATECTIYIRKGIKWSDGEPLTANDIAFTYNYLKQHAPDLRDSATVDNTVESVEAVDDYTVKFMLKEPSWRFHFSHCTFRFDRGIYLVPKHIWEGVETPLEFTHFDVEKGYPVVSGPYQITRFEPQVKHFDRRYEWWAYDIGLIDHMPEVERLVNIGFSGEEVAAQMIINGEVDVSLDLRPATLEAILNQAEHVVSFTGKEKPYGYVDWWPISMYFNTLEAPYDDPRVRWAVAYAVDQQTLVDVGWNGAGETTNGPFPYYPGLTKYIEGAQEVLDEYNVLESNLDKVDELMTEAGFEKDSEGFWVDGEGNRPNADIYAGVPLFGDIAPVTAELMRKAGFEANHVTPPDVWDAKSDGRALLHFFGHGGSVADPYVTLQMYHSQWQKPTGENCGQNRPRWANEEYDAIIEEMGRTPMDNYEKMQELFNQAMAIWYRELPEVPLVQWFHRLAMNTMYWENWPTQDNPYNSAPWHLTCPITLWNLKAKS